MVDELPPEERICNVVFLAEEENVIADLMAQCTGIANAARFELIGFGSDGNELLTDKSEKFHSKRWAHVGNFTNTVRFINVGKGIGAAIAALFILQPEYAIIAVKDTPKSMRWNAELIGVLHWSSIPFTVVIVEGESVTSDQLARFQSMVVDTLGDVAIAPIKDETRQRLLFRLSVLKARSHEIAAPTEFVVFRRLCTVTGESVVFGRLRKGLLRVGDPLHCGPRTGAFTPCTVQSIHHLHRGINEARAGMVCALSVRDWAAPTMALRRGDSICARPYPLVAGFEAFVWLSTQDGVKRGQFVFVHSFLFQRNCRISSSRRGEGFTRIELSVAGRPIPFRSGDEIVFRDQRVLAFGVIIRSLPL